MKGYLKFLSEENAHRLVPRLRRMRFAPSEVILAEGEQRRALFLLRSGEVRVERSHMGFNVEVSRLRAGEIFGEMSFVEEYGASASVIADGDVEVDVIEAADIRDLLEESSDFGREFYRSIAEIISRRLRETTIRSIADYSWGGHVVEDSGRPRGDTDWGGGSPLRDGGR